MRGRLALVLVLLLLLGGCTRAPSTVPSSPAEPTTAAPSTPAPPWAKDRRNVAFRAKDGTRSRYHVYANGLTQRPKGLILQFHGDKAYEFLHPEDPYCFGGPDGMAAQATRRGYLLVAVLTPDTVGTRTWWEDGERNARFARDLLAHLLKAYPVDRTNVWLVGYSGGSQFITKHYLPRYSSTIKGGGAVLFAGGGPPEIGAQPFARSLRRHFPMYWYTGAADTAANSEYGWDALAAARYGKAYYADRGFTVASRWPTGVGHHDVAGRFGRVVGQRLDS